MAPIRAIPLLGHASVRAVADTYVVGDGHSIAAVTASLCCHPVDDRLPANIIVRPPDDTKAALIEHGTIGVRQADVHQADRLDAAVNREGVGVSKRRDCEVILDSKASKLIGLGDMHFLVPSLVVEKQPQLPAGSDTIIYYNLIKVNIIV